MYLKFLLCIGINTDNILKCYYKSFYSFICGPYGIIFLMKTGMCGTPIMSFRCGIQLWQNGSLLQRNYGASEHTKTIWFFAGSVILGGASSPPGPVIEACDKKQEHWCWGTTLYLCSLGDNCESLASECCETVDKINSLSHLYFEFLD